MIHRLCYDSSFYDLEHKLYSIENEASLFMGLENVNENVFHSPGSVNLEKVLEILLKFFVRSLTGCYKEDSFHMFTTRAGAWSVL